jgi:hypothetical protein
MYRTRADAPTRQAGKTRQRLNILNLSSPIRAIRGKFDKFRP